jgi:catechol 2,3-dioxygenase-like lactoylglutathione lyase family enzyme
MNTTPVFTLWGVVLGAPDAHELAGFYQRLLGWPIEQDEPDWVKLRSPVGGPGLSFQTEAHYERPIWPAGPGDQQMSMHLDIAVDDMAAAGAHAVAVGAVLADYQPEDDVRVYFDPDGHPFCLFLRD